jgi:Phytanoyl-CoA dioxygenase (PhyH)
MREKLAYRFEQLLNERVLTDAIRFHEDRRSTDARWVLAVKNVLAPERLLTRARYGQVATVPKRLSRAERPAAAPPDLDRAEVARLLAEFRRNGVVRLSGDRTELVRRIAKRHDAVESGWEPSAHYTRTLLDPTADEDALALITDPLLLGLLAGYYGAQPFVRDAPTVNITFPNITGEEARGGQSDWASDWHWDTPNLVSVHVMLCDIPTDGTRMLYAKGSHKRPHVRIGETDRWYSEEFVRSRYEVFDCAGPQGSIFVFDNNGLHRLEAVPDRFRASFEFYWTPGNSLNRLVDRAATETSEWIRIDEALRQETRGELPPLAPLQRRALAGLLGEVPPARS